MPRYVVTIQTESRHTVYAEDIYAAEANVKRQVAQADGGGFKLMSIIVEGYKEPEDTKPPTPFGAPPSGTPGAGTPKLPTALVDQIAVAA